MKRPPLDGVHAGRLIDGTVKCQFRCPLCKHQGEWRATAWLADDDGQKHHRESHVQAVSA